MLCLITGGGGAKKAWGIKVHKEEKALLATSGASWPGVKRKCF